MSDCNAMVVGIGARESNLSKQQLGFGASARGGSAPWQLRPAVFPGEFCGICGGPRGPQQVERHCSDVKKVLGTDPHSLIVFVCFCLVCNPSHTSSKLEEPSYGLFLSSPVLILVLLVVLIIVKPSCPQWGCSHLLVPTRSASCLHGYSCSWGPTPWLRVGRRDGVMRWWGTAVFLFCQVFYAKVQLLVVLQLR